MECEEKLRSYLSAFKDKEISAMNHTIAINGSVSVVLSNWVCTHDKLEIIISVDNMHCEDTARETHTDSGLFQMYISHVSSVLEDEGYGKIAEFEFVEQDDVFDCKAYRYKTTISNPVSSE